jgi:hypothetical protein
MGRVGADPPLALVAGSGHVIEVIHVRAEGGNTKAHETPAGRGRHHRPHRDRSVYLAVGSVGAMQAEAPLALILK